MRAMRRPTPAVCAFAAALVVTGAQAQGLRDESYSAGKNPAQLFASDCTGSGCHSGPQGLAKGKAPNDLAAYLRAHYTDSKQTAAALAAYLTGVAGEARPARGRPERIERVERPAPQESQDRAAREQRDWLPFQLPNLFGRQEAQEPPRQQEATPPPVRAPQRARSAAKPEQSARTPSERAVPSSQEESTPRSEGSLFSAFSALFGREDETKAAAPPEPVKPTPRMRKTSRQQPKDDEALRPPARLEAPPPPARRSTRQPPNTEEAAKPSSEETAPRLRTQPSIRQAPKSDAAKPNAAAKPPKPEEATKPAGDTESAALPRTRQPTRPPPKSEEATAPVTTGTLPKRSRRTEPLFPITEDNAGPPPASDIYRPARRDPSSLAPSTDQVIAPGDIILPSRESGQRLIFD
jgi:hypothetical protein